MIRHRDVLGFLAFSHGWTWSFWALAGAVGESVWDWPGVLFLYVGGAGVPLGGAVMAWRVYGRAGLEDLGRRIVAPGRVAGRWWAVSFLLFPLLTFLAAGVALAAGITSEPLDLGGAVARLLDPAGFVGFVLFILVLGPLPEEIGWRGYLLDRLQLRWSALTASFFIAAVWWAWHLPLAGLPGYFDAFARVPPSPLEILYGILPAAVVYTWVYNNTARSVLAVIVLHFMHNFTGEFLGMNEEVRTVRLVMEALVAAGAVVVWGPNTLGRGRPLESPPPER